MRRTASHAGTFYPRFASQLNPMIEGWIQSLTLAPVNGRSLALVLPHAGYMYSGKCAAAGYQTLMHEHVDSFIILHPSHYGGHFDFSVSPYTVYESPMGDLELDEELAATFSPWADKDVHTSYHQKEHSMEIQLPFIKKLFPTAKILPLMIGNQTPEVAQRLAQLIYALLFKNEKKIVVLVSTDLSHYHSATKAKGLDHLLQTRLQNLDAEGLWEDIQAEKCEACGIGGLLTVIEMANSFSNPKVEIINYTHSGTVSGDNGQVVGYLSARISS